MKLLVVACLIAAACAYPSQLGTKKCTYGPSYWCENYKQAIECKAIEHCRKFVWKAKVEDNCDECKAAVKQFNAFVNANSSKVIEIMKNVCGGLETGAAECKYAVDTYGSEIIGALKEVTADGEKLCQELEMCSSTDKVKIIKTTLLKKLKTHPYILALKSVKADYCADCKMVFAELKDILQDQDMQKEIIAAVEELCSEFGTFAAQCKTYVDQYLPLVLDELASLDDPTELCTELGLCNSTKAIDQQKPILPFPVMPGPVMITPPKKNVKAPKDNCDSCKAAVEQVHSYLANNSSKVLEIMDNVCDSLGSMAATCKGLVKQYGKEIINTLEELTADSEKLCQELEMCPSTDKVQIQIIKKIILRHIKAHPKFVGLKSVKDEYCDDCKLVFAELKDVLQDKEVEQELANALETLCADLGSLADQCKEYVSGYLPLIMEELANLDDPSEICNELHLCNSTKKAVEISASQILPAKKRKLLFPLFMPGPVMITPPKTKKNKEVKKPEASVECIICEYAMSELDKILGDNATKEEIEAALDKLCSLLPSTVRSECDSFVNTYGPEIIRLLLNELQPSQICTELGLCSGKPAKFSFKKGTSPNDEKCDLCKFAVQYLQSILETNATEEEIKKALEDICNLLPSSLKTECLALVEEYGDLIIKLIEGEITPEEVCELLKLCAASSKLQMKDKCDLGESYWCANYKNAMKCGKLEHCSNYIV